MPTEETDCNCCGEICGGWTAEAPNLTFTFTQYYREGDGDLAEPAESCACLAADAIATPNKTAAIRAFFNPPPSGNDKLLHVWVSEELGCEYPELFAGPLRVLLGLYYNTVSQTCTLVSLLQCRTSFDGVIAWNTVTGGSATLDPVTLVGYSEIALPSIPLPFGCGHCTYSSHESAWGTTTLATLWVDISP